MRRITFIQLFVFLFFGCWAAVAFARPMAIQLADLRTQAKHVLVARYDGPVKGSTTEYMLQIERVVQGSLSAGAQKVLASPDGAPTVEVGARCVAFLDDKLQFRWVATPGAGQTLDDGFLYLRGFYDYNAYIVSPSLITLAKLETYVSTGKLHYDFAGSLYFLDAGRLAASTTSLSFSFEPGLATTKVTGMPKLAGFPKEPQIRITSGAAPDVELIYNDNLARPLSIGGKILSVDKKTGDLQAMFWPIAPSLFQKADFLDYISDAKKGAPSFEIAITLSSGELFTFMYLPNTGRVGSMQGPSKDSYQVSRLVLAPTREIGFTGDGEITVTLAAAKGAPLLSETGIAGKFLQEFLSGPISGTFARSKGKLPALKSDCTLTLVKIHYSKI